MSCEFYKELIFKKLDNEINDEEEKVLLEHLQSCSECQTDLKQLSEIEDILDNQQMVDVPYSFSRAVVDKIQQPVKKRFFIRPIFTVAAACIILVLAFYSHAFDNLLSADNIVQKQNTNSNNSSNSLQEDISNKLKDNDKEQVSSYLYAEVAEDKKTNNDINQSKIAEAKPAENNQTQAQKQPENTQPSIQKRIAKEEGTGGATEENDGMQEDSAVENQNESQGRGSGQMFMASATTPTDGTQSSYKTVVTINAEKQQVLDILKKYSITQKSELEFELLISEFDKLSKELNSKNIIVEVKDLNINSDVVLLVIIDK